MQSKGLLWEVLGMERAAMAQLQCWWVTSGWCSAGCSVWGLWNAPGRAAVAFPFNIDMLDHAGHSKLNVVEEISTLTAACQVSSINSSLSERQGNSVALSSDVIECLHWW